MTDTLQNWPPKEGRYQVGRKTSPIAVCTNATIDDIEINPEKVAIWGKCVIENIGVEKIIQNIVSNPNIRYLVLCGKPSKGHFISQAIESLIENGINKDKRIIGAKGNMPYLRGIDGKLIQRFREQIIPVNLIGQTDSKKIEEVIDKLLETKPSEFSKQAIKIENLAETEASSNDKWIPDPNGFFIVSVDRDKNRLLVEHYQENKVSRKIVGDNACDISDTIAKMNLVGDFEQTKEHYLYLGRELQKAEIALKNNLDYEQDKELSIKDNPMLQRGDKGRDEDEWHD